MSAKLMGQVWDLDLPHAEAWVLMALADHADHDGGNVFPGQELIAYKTGYSTRQVRRIMESLEEKKIIVPETGGKGRGQKRRYRIAIKNAPVKTARPEQDCAISGQNVRLSSKEKGDKASAFSGDKRGQNVRQIPDKMSSFPKQKADISGTEKRTFSTQKADISDGSHDKERARVNRHEPSHEPSIARAHGLQGEPFNPQPESPVTADLTPNLSPLEFALCAAVRWLPDNLNSKQWDQLVRASNQLSRYPDATPDLVLYAPAFYQSQRKFNFGVEWIAKDWGLISAWLATRSIPTSAPPKDVEPPPTRPRTGQWGRALNLLDKTIGSEAVSAWFEPLEYLGLEDGQVQLRSPDPVFRQWIEGNYSTQLADALREVGLGERSALIVETGGRK